MTTATAHHEVVTHVPEMYAIKKGNAYVSATAKDGGALVVDEFGSLYGNTPVTTPSQAEAIKFADLADAREVCAYLHALRYTACRLVRIPAHDITALTDAGKAAVAARRAARNADRKW